MSAARLKSFGELTPRAHRVMSATASFALALSAAHRVVDRVHRHSAYFRPAAEPACPSSLAAGNVHMINVADLTHSGVGALVDPPHFTGRQANQRVSALAVAQDRLLSGAAFSPAITLDPTPSPFGARMYAFSPLL